MRRLGRIVIPSSKPDWDASSLRMFKEILVNTKHDHDLVIRGGTVFDGSGNERTEADVAISDGVITEVGRVRGSGVEEIDARGKMVTPGFVDVHTHYDGQVTWDQRMQPSSWHGVTTAVMGN